MKKVILPLLFLLLVGGIFYGVGRYSNLSIQNKLLKQQLNSDEISVDQDVISSDEPITTGSIKGDLTFPSEYIPAMIVYALVANNHNEYYFVETKENEGSFTIEDLVPGTYHLISFPKDRTDDLGGGYTQAVPCGLSVDCNDHSFISVTVVAGETISEGISLGDWYAPEGTLPGRP